MNNQDIKTNNKIYDLEKRTLVFSKAVIRICKDLSRSPMNDRLVNQTVGSAGSMGANYREANDCLGDKDFLHCMRIARKEAKECVYWLELIIEANPNFNNRIQDLIKECIELKNIFSAIIRNRENTVRNK